METKKRFNAKGSLKLAIMLAMVFAVFSIKGQNSRTSLQTISSDNTTTAEQKNQLKTEWIKNNPSEYARLSGNTANTLPEFNSQSEKDKWHNVNTSFIITPPVVGVTNIKSKELTMREEKLKNWKATQDFIAKHKDQLDADFELVYYSDFASVSKDKKEYILMNPSLFLVLPAEIAKPIQ